MIDSTLHLTLFFQEQEDHPETYNSERKKQTFNKKRTNRPIFDDNIQEIPNFSGNPENSQSKSNTKNVRIRKNNNLRREFEDQRNLLPETEKLPLNLPAQDGRNLYFCNNTDHLLMQNSINSSNINDYNNFQNRAKNKSNGICCGTSMDFDRNEAWCNISGLLAMLLNNMFMIWLIIYLPDIISKS